MQTRFQQFAVMACSSHTAGAYQAEVCEHLLWWYMLTVFSCAAVAEQHAELQQKGKQVFLKALQGESVFDK